MAKRPRTQQERVEQARAKAALALESIASNADMVRDHNVQGLVRLALQDYRFKFAAYSAKREWLFYDGDPSTSKIKIGRDGNPLTGRVDVYCTFCRVMLVNDARFDHDYSAQLQKHTTMCALRSLAGLLIPGGPGVYRLPEAL